MGKFKKEIIVITTGLLLSVGLVLWVSGALADLVVAFNRAKAEDLVSARIFPVVPTELLNGSRIGGK